MINKEDNKQEEQDIQKSLNYFIIHELENTELGDVNVKGSEVKEKLLVHKGAIINTLEHCIRKMGTISNEIGEKPMDTCPEMPSIYKYSYKQIYPKDYISEESQETSDYGYGVSKEESEPVISPEKQEKMREYNRYAHEMIQAKENLGFTKQMIDNIKENKEYKLPIRVANHLGIE